MALDVHNINIFEPSFFAPSACVWHSQNYHHYLGENYLPQLTITIKPTIILYNIRDSDLLIVCLKICHIILYYLVFKLFIKISVSYAYKHVAIIMI